MTFLTCFNPERSTLTGELKRTVESVTSSPATKCTKTEIGSTMSGAIATSPEAHIANVGLSMKSSRVATGTDAGDLIIPAPYTAVPLDERPKTEAGSTMSGVVPTGPKGHTDGSRNRIQSSTTLASSTQGNRTMRPAPRSKLPLGAASNSETTAPGHTVDSGYASQPRNRQKPRVIDRWRPDSYDKENED